MKKVQILLSTYNGEKYITQQLNSILNQTYKNISILVRDDGSKDNTIKILTDYKNKGLIDFYTGKNIGVSGSFFDLIKNAPQADYYSFSDQDDVWILNKIDIAVNFLNKENPNKYVIYGSQINVVDSNLKFLHTGKKIKKLSFSNSLIENVMGGLTMVFNETTLKRLKKIKHSDDIFLHDWYLFILGNCLGKIIYDETPTVLYRQHSNNSIGASHSIISEIKRRIKFFKSFSKNDVIYKNAKNFYINFKNEMPKKEKIYLKNFLNCKYSTLKRIKLSFSKDFYRQRKLDSICYKILFFFGFL